MTFNVKSFCGTMIAGALALAAVAPAQAAMTELEDSFGNKTGWAYSADAGVELWVSALYVDGSNTVYLNKSAEFKTVDPLNITFYKLDLNSPVTNFIIDAEEVANLTGQTWTSFEFEVDNGATFDSTASVGFGIGEDDPFDAGNFSNDKTLYSVSGGTGVADLSVWTPGDDDSDLVIIRVGGNDRYWQLIERPVGPGVPPPVIPLPAAAWSGLGGLAALGTLAGLRKARRALR